MSVEITRLHPKGPVDIRTTDDTGHHRSVRNPRDDLSDLPELVRAAIEDHWTLERIALWDELTAPEPEPAPSAGDVSVERDRRIRIMIGAESADETMRIVMRGTREASRMMNKELRKGQALSVEEQARADELEALDASITAIEDAAAALKATEGGIPADFTDNKYWPTGG